MLLGEADKGCFMDPSGSSGGVGWFHQRGVTEKRELERVADIVFKSYG